jgi:hypothetical protein
MCDYEISEEALCSYLETLLWSETLNQDIELDGDTYDEGTPLDQIPGLDVSDLETLAPKIVEEAREDLQGFAHECLRGLGFNPFVFFDEKQVAHDFALSRNGHGAGFFDDSYELSAKGPNGFTASTEFNDRLQDIARNAGTHGLSAWVDESGALCLESHS